MNRYKQMSNDRYFYVMNTFEHRYLNGCVISLTSTTNFKGEYNFTQRCLLSLNLSEIQS